MFHVAGIVGRGRGDDPEPLIEVGDGPDGSLYTSSPLFACIYDFVGSPVALLFHSSPFVHFCFYGSVSNGLHARWSSTSIPGLA